MIAALEFRLRSRASFQEKLLQFVGKSATSKKGRSSAPFLIFRMPRWRQI
jgi:hypothetical protein